LPIRLWGEVPLYLCARLLEEILNRSKRSSSENSMKNIELAEALEKQTHPQKQVGWSWLSGAETLKLLSIMIEAQLLIAPRNTSCTHRGLRKTFFYYKCIKWKTIQHLSKMREKWYLTNSIKKCDPKSFCFPNSLTRPNYTLRNIFRENATIPINNVFFFPPFFSQQRALARAPKASRPENGVRTPQTHEQARSPENGRRFGNEQNMSESPPAALPYASGEKTDVCNMLLQKCLKNLQKFYARSSILDPRS